MFSLILFDQEIMVEVLCVDDGTREQLPLSRLRPLEEQFAQLPSQALCCALSGVLPLASEPTDKGRYNVSVYAVLCFDGFQPKELHLSWVFCFQTFSF